MGLCDTSFRDRSSSPRPRCRVGRVPTSDHLDDARVSSEHAVLHHNGSRLEIRDLGSTNGTWVNRQRFPKGERALLSAGAFLMFGGRDLTFELVDASPPIASARQIETGELRHATSGLLVLPNEEHPVASVFERRTARGSSSCSTSSAPSRTATS